MSSLAGKVVMITGASSGFGEDAARLFAKEGCKLVLAARRLDRLQALAENIQAQGGEALAVTVDLTQQDEIDSMVRSALERFGRIDILFNNAGFGRLDWLENLDPEADIQAQVDVNLLGLIQTTRAVLPHMLACRSGQIINMSSVAGFIAAPLYTIYAATKFGVRGFTDALRREVAPFGVQISGIYPGPAVTEFSLHTGRNSAKSALSRFKGLSMTSESVAQRVVGLARHPRRTLIIPWWYRPAAWVSENFPALVDWFLLEFFTKKHHEIKGS
jgi:NADP-dependent 3-hydroxy acid dehydrogenase YdfG